MKKDFKIMVNYMKFMANTLNYNSWNNDYVGKEFLSNMDKVRDDFRKQKIDFSLFSDEELKMLGFSDWSDEFKNLIPLWIFRLLEDDAELVCFSGGEATKEKADDDVRFGCVAYKLKDK